jgi:hypothetical protein
MPSEPCRYQPPKFVSVQVLVFKECKTGPSLSDVLSPTSADTDKARFAYKTVSCLQGEEAKTQLLFERVARAEALQCNPIEAIAAVPDWWQVRIEGRRPQLIMHFAEMGLDGKLDKTKYVISIPQALNVKPLASPISAYRKGQYEGILTLNDNSKLIVNAISETEAQRVIDEASGSIDPKYLNGSFIKIGIRKGQALKQIMVYPKYAKFFSSGLQSLQPDWVVSFDN